MKLVNTISLPIQLKAILLEDLRQGGLKAGDAIPSYHEWAKKYKVSLPTMQKAMTLLVKEGVIWGRPGKGSYIVALPRKSIRKIREIGIVFFDIFSVTDPYVEPLLKGIDSIASRKEYNLHILAMKKALIRDKGNAFILSLLIKKQIDGLLIASPLKRADLLFLQQKMIPFVVLANEYRDLEVPSVIIDHRKIITTATQYLIEAGHKNIALLFVEEINPGDGKVSAAAGYVSAYRKALCSAGLSFMQELVTPVSYDEESALAATEKLLSSSDKPTGVIAMGHYITKGVLKALAKNKGSSIAVISCLESREELPCKIIREPIFEMGKNGMKMLDAILAGKELDSNKIVLKPTLEIR